MSLTGDDGSEREIFHNGETIRIRVHYTAQHPVRSPIFEIAIHRGDGTLVTSVSTQAMEYDPGDLLEGEGYIEWAIDDVRLTAGSYYLSPKLIDQTGLHVLDEQERWYRFQVRKGAYPDTGGAVVLPGTWSHARTREGAPAADAPIA